MAEHEVKNRFKAIPHCKRNILFTYLARTHLVECHKRKSLRQHRTCKILLCQNERNQDRAKSELWDKGERLEFDGARRRWDGRREMQERVVW